MPDPRNPRFEDFPETAYLDPAAFVSAMQQQEQQEFENVDDDRGLLGIATLVLAGIGGYAALKHFPPRRIRALAGEIKDILLRPEGVGLGKTPQIDKIREAMNSLPESVLRQPWSAVHRDKFGQVLGKIDAANDPEMLRTLRQIYDIASKNEHGFATNVQAQKVIKAHLTRPIPQDASGFRTITLGDLFDSAGGWQQKVWNMEMPKSLSQLQNVTKDLVKIPGLKDNIKLMNMRIDPNLLVNRHGGGNAIQLLDLRRGPFGIPLPGHPSSVVKGLQRAAQTGSTQWFKNPRMMAAGAAAGFYAGYDADDPVSTVVGTAAGFMFGSIPIRHLARGARWATELLVPTELIKQTPDVAIFGKDITKQFMPKDWAGLKGVSHTIVAHGNVIPIFGRQAPFMGPSVAQGVRVGSASSSMARAAKVRAKEDIFIARKLAKPSLSRADEYIDKIESETGRQMNKVKAGLIKLGDMVGVGPQFKRGRSVLSDVPTVENIPKTMAGIFVDYGKELRRQTMDFVRDLAGGKASIAGAEEHFAYRPLQGLSDHSNYLMLRVGRLFEQTTGLGIQAGATPGETAARWVKLGVGAMFAWEGLRYLDYHTRRVTGTGPISAPLQAYAAVRNTQQHLFAATGIQQGAAYLENLMPGLVNSPLSALIRANTVNRLLRGMSPFGGTFGAGLAAKMSMAGLGTTGKVLTAAATFTQLTDITQSPANLAAVYRGEVDVPVREGRFWALGSLPFGGGRVTHTRPHLIPTILSHAREIGTYGSEGGYWGAQLGLPVPENLFNLRPLLTPYATEQRNYANRPYPLTGPFPGVLGNIPFVGETFNATIGELIKPTQRWHGVEREGFGGIGGSIGFDPIRGVRDVGDPTSAIERIGKQIDVLREFLGMPGFLAGAIKYQITGDANFDLSKRQLATAGQMTGMERALYDMDLGGGLGMTEMLRRFLPHRRRDIQQVNNIRNTMPAWLPGSGSVFPNDREFYRDFHRGDPMGAIKSGEARLPGAGYEAVHRLHSGVPGVYDAYDRWKILRDVAPTSQAFRHYDAIVKGWARTQSARASDPAPLAGLPGSRSLGGVVKAVLDGDTIVVDSSGQLINVRIAGANAPELAHSAFEAAMPGSIGGELAKRRLENEILGKPVMLNPRDLDVYGRMVADVSSVGIGGRNVSEELREAFKTYDMTQTELGQVQTVRDYQRTRFEPYPFTHRIFKDPLATVPRNMRDMATSSLTAINKEAKRGGRFTLPEKMVGHLWEQVSHINLPGPANWPVNKLFAQRDPLEVYRQRMLSGGSFANWETPFQSFILPWANQTIGAFDKSYVPGRVRAQRRALAQQDALNYRRNKMFAQQAMAIGNTGAADQFNRRAGSTAAGVILTGNRRSARSALSRIERGFYDPMAAETNPGTREAILHSVSPQMGTMLKMAWGTGTPEDRAPTAALVEATSPPQGWIGLHPDVTPGMLKAKVAHDNAWDFHELGVSQAENYASMEIFSDAFEVPAPPLLFSASTHSKSITMMNRMGVSTHTLNTVDSLFGPSVSMRLSRDPRKYDHVLRTYGYAPTSQGMRF